MLKFFSKQAMLLSRPLHVIRDCTGGVAVELALVFSLFGVPMMLGTSELAWIVYDSIELSNCAHAGAMYAMMSSTFAADSSGIQNATRAEASDFGSNVNVSSSTYYACSNSIDGTQYSTQAAANAVCPASGSNHYLQFVKVAASMTFSPPVQCPGLPKTFTISRTSTMEVQE